jgi:CheY-like chemotaxis protein
LQRDLGVEGDMNTVLVLDDDDLICRSIARILRARGHAVVRCASADEAVRICQTQPIDVVLSDVHVPGSHAPTLAARLRADCQDVSVVFMSGEAERALVERGLLDPGARFIAKPFLPDALVQMLSATRLRTPVAQSR